jgi:hypothetical protein
LKAVVQSYVPENIDPASDQFYNLTIPVRLTLMVTSLEACAVICNWFKIIPILSLSKTFMVMVKTIAKSGRQVGGFFIIFMIIMYGFTQAFTMVYGYRLYQYQTMEKSFFSLLKSLLGDFDFDELRDANPYVGPALFIVFVGLAVGGTAVYLDAHCTHTLYSHTVLAHCTRTLYSHTVPLIGVRAAQHADCDHL